MDQLHPLFNAHKDLLHEKLQIIIKALQQSGFFIESTQKKIREGFIELKRMKGKERKKLYCVLYKDFIYFFLPHERVSLNARPYTLIDLKFITSVEYGKAPCTFNVSTPLRRFVLKVKHEVAVDQWIEKIDERRYKKTGLKDVEVVRGKSLVDHKGYFYSKDIKGKMRLIDLTNNIGQVYKFPKTAPLGGSVGRSSSNELTISVDPFISRSHCKIEIRDNIPFLLDLGTNTGTFLNEKQVTSAPLKPGDVIKLGKSDFEFQVKEGEAIFTKAYTNSSESKSEDEKKKKKKKKKEEGIHVDLDD